MIDIIEMEYCENKYDVIIDKGTLDSILCSEGSSQNAIKAIRNIYKSLNNNGRYICISYGIPDYRSQYFETDFTWTLEIHKILKGMIETTNTTPEESPKNLLNYHYIYICHKTA